MGKNKKYALAEQSRAEQSRAEQSRAEQSRAEQSRAVSFDFLKGIGCICVVFIHVLFPGNLGYIVLKLSEFAVPCFLMISGYFTYIQKCNEEKLKRKASKTFKLTFFHVYSICCILF